jgi:GNAT superfamily N-acetyltransferase
MARLSDADLAQRVLDGLLVEVELFGASSESGSVHRAGGLVSAVAPAAPERSIFNSVYATDPGELPAAIDEIEERYAAAGVRAWTVWLPGGNRLGPELLEPRGHVHDGSPRSMGLELDYLVPPERPLPSGVELLGGDVREVAAINDRAYELGPGAWRSALTRPSGLAVQWAVAALDGEPVACAGAIDSGEDDVCITAVGTVPELKGNGLAGHLITALLTEAQGRGIRTATLQASKAGAPVYERLGFRDVGCTDLWEKRAPN